MTLIMKKLLRNYFDDILLVAGSVCIVYGLWLWNIVVMWIVAGLILIIGGVLVGIMEARNDIE